MTWVSKKTEILKKREVVVAAIQERERDKG